MKIYKNLLVACFFVSVNFIATNCATSSKKSTLYKGASKHTQPSLTVFPKANIYNFDKKLDEVTEKKLNEKMDELFLKHNIAGVSATILVPNKGIWEINRGFVSRVDNIVVDDSSLFYWVGITYCQCLAHGKYQ